MIIPITKINRHGSDVVVGLVDSALTQPGGAGDEIIYKLSRHFVGRPVMLVSLEDNGYRAYAPFQTHQTLMALQREQLTFSNFDVDAPLPEPEAPF